MKTDTYLVDWQNDFQFENSRFEGPFHNDDGTHTEEYKNWYDDACFEPSSSLYKCLRGYHIVHVLTRNVTLESAMSEEDRNAIKAVRITMEKDIGYTE